MLQVSLAPAPVAARVRDEVLGTLLVGAAEVRIEPHGPAGAREERRLGVVVAQHLAAEGRAAGQHRKAAQFSEGADPEDRVVTPERPGRPLGDVEPAGENRGVEGARELRRAPEAAASAHDARICLKEAEAGVGLHPAHHLDDGRTFHEAVGIEHHGVVVAPAAGLDEIGDVAGLAARPVVAPAVVDPGASLAFRQQPRVPVALGGGDALVPRVREDRDVETASLTRPRQRGLDGRDARPRLGGLLAADGHENDRRAEFRVVGRRRAGTGPPREHAGERLGRAEGEPPRRRADEHSAQHVRRGHAVRRRGAAERQGRRDGGQRGEGDGRGTRRARAGGRAGRPGGRQRRAAQILRAHRDGGRRRKPGIAGRSGLAPFADGNRV